MNAVPHLELVQFIEDAIRSTGSEVLFTHHPGDLNNDHHHVSIACQAAARLPMRAHGVPPLQALNYMELLSATDWSLMPQPNGFHPNTLVPIGEEGLERKLAALRAYRGVLRPFPHSRSEEVIRSLAVYRGAQGQVPFGEAFESPLRILRAEAGGR
jgi:LmbE family N-acetylglucosaminyl deacetylase